MKNKVPDLLQKRKKAPQKLQSFHKCGMIEEIKALLLFGNLVFSVRTHAANGKNFGGKNMADGKIVYYNGGTESYRSCSKPDQLTKGIAYRVIAEKDLGTQTNYTLDGIVGEFNSAWFDELLATKLMVSYEVPQVGKKVECNRLYTLSGKPILKKGTIDTVVGVQRLTDILYLVTTKRDIYAMQVMAP